jgi:hypothetical protein
VKFETQNKQSSKYSITSTRMDRAISITPPSKLILEYVNGHTGFFVWTLDSLNAVKAGPGKFNLTYQVKKLVQADEYSPMVAIAIVAPDEGDLEVVAKEFRRFHPNVAPRNYLYDFVEREEGENRLWEFEAGQKPGEVVEKRFS